VLRNEHLPTRLASGEVEIVYNTLLALESSLIQQRSDYASLADAIQRRDAPAGVAAMTRACDTRNAIASAIVTLKRHTANEDQARGRCRIQSVGDLALRATLLLVVELLAQLQEVVVLEPDKTDRLFGSRLRSIRDVSDLVLEGFAGAVRLWRPVVADGPILASRDPEHYRILREVRAAIAATATDLELSQFLLIGILSVDSPVLARVCAQLAVVLRLDMEAAPGGPSSPPRSQSAHDTVEMGAMHA
jgi:hypothetical protein